MRLYDDIIITGERAVARSYAKINLTLDVLGRRQNGYHDVCMVMQSLRLFDLLIIGKSDKTSLTCNIADLPCDSGNIAVKAADLFFAETGICGGANIILNKNIPIAAGLAGGSGNAAAVLCALNLLYNAHLDDGALLKLGAKLGADVPYCILGGTQLAEGIGEKLTELKSVPLMNILLVKPPISVSTAAIYNAIDTAGNLAHPDTKAMLDAINRSSACDISGSLQNIMETVTSDLYPEISEIKSKMLALGAAGAVMSGSGPTVFGIFDDIRKAKTACDEFSKSYKEVFLTKTYN